MIGKYRCRWVRARLPLLAGHELVGSERRWVERHLIGCPDCRQRRTVLTNALGVLHEAAVQSPLEPAEMPSLWPALARQIRESRRPVSSPDFASLSFSFGGLRFGLGSALVGLSLGLLVAIGLGERVRPQRPKPQPKYVALPRLIPPKVSVPTLLPKTPAPSRDFPTRKVETPVVENTPPRSFDYDLEHGTPMPLDAPRDTRDTMSTH